MTPNDADRIVDFNKTITPYCLTEEDDEELGGKGVKTMTDRKPFARVEIFPTPSGVGTEEVVVVGDVPVGRPWGHRNIEAFSVNAAFEKAVQARVEEFRGLAALVADHEDSTGWIGKQIRALSVDPEEAKP